MSHAGHPIDVIKRLFSEQKWDEMVAFCKKMLDEDPNDLVALQNTAAAYLRLKRFDEAVSICDKVLAFNTNDEYALKNKIYALESLRRFDDVIACCELILAGNPADNWAIDSKGLSLNELGRHDDALSCYDLSLKYDPNNTTALMNKAMTLAFMKKYSDAIACYDRAQKLDKSIAGIAAAKSDAYQKLGLEDEAFLAAQGVLDEDVPKFKEEAKKRHMRIFDWYCLNEFNELEARDRLHREKMNSKISNP